jgi:hypothetical protein
MTLFAKETKMMFRSAIAALVVLVAITGFAQGASPDHSAAMPLKRQTQSPAGKNAATSLVATKGQVAASLRDRVNDMEATLAKMHTVLKQMRTKAASNPKDPLAQTNVEMWQLMVDHLDKQFQELRMAMLMREDMEARRAAMYKDAEARADAAAAAARRRAADAKKEASSPEKATPDAVMPTPAPAGAASAPSAPSTSSPK